MLGKGPGACGFVRSLRQCEQRLAPAAGANRGFPEDLLLGGAQQAQVTALRTDDSEIEQDVNDMFTNF